MTSDPCKCLNSWTKSLELEWENTLMNLNKYRPLSWASAPEADEAQVEADRLNQRPLSQEADVSPEDVEREEHNTPPPLRTRRHRRN